MNITSILDHARALIMNNASVELTAQEIRILCDPMQLRAFKLSCSIPADYQAGDSAEHYKNLICRGESTESDNYLVLAFLALKNPVIRKSLRKSFPVLLDDQ